MKTCLVYTIVIFTSSVRTQWPSAHHSSLQQTWPSHPPQAAAPQAHWNNPSQYWNNPYQPWGANVGQPSVASYYVPTTEPPDSPPAKIVVVQAPPPSTQWQNPGWIPPVNPPIQNVWGQPTVQQQPTPWGHQPSHHQPAWQSTGQNQMHQQPTWTNPRPQQTPQSQWPQTPAQQPAWGASNHPTTWNQNVNQPSHHQAWPQGHQQNQEPRQIQNAPTIPAHPPASHQQQFSHHQQPQQQPQGPPPHQYQNFHQGQHQQHAHSRQNQTPQTNRHQQQNNGHHELVHALSHSPQTQELQQRQDPHINHHHHSLQNPDNQHMYQPAEYLSTTGQPAPESRHRLQHQEQQQTYEVAPRADNKGNQPSKSIEYVTHIETRTSVIRTTTVQPDVPPRDYYIQSQLGPPETATSDPSIRVQKYLTDALHHPPVWPPVPRYDHPARGSTPETSPYTARQHEVHPPTQDQRPHEPVPLDPRQSTNPHHDPANHQHPKDASHEPPNYQHVPPSHAVSPHNPPAPALPPHRDFPPGHYIPPDGHPAIQGPPQHQISPPHAGPPLQHMSPIHAGPPLQHVAPPHAAGPPLQHVAPPHAGPPLQHVEPPHAGPPLQHVSPPHAAGQPLQHVSPPNSEPHALTAPDAMGQYNDPIITPAVQTYGVLHPDGSVTEEVYSLVASRVQRLVSFTTDVLKMMTSYMVFDRIKRTFAVRSKRYRDVCYAGLLDQDLIDSYKEVVNKTMNVDFPYIEGNAKVFFYKEEEQILFSDVLREAGHYVAGSCGRDSVIFRVSRVINSETRIGKMVVPPSACPFGPPLRLNYYSVSKCANGTCPVNFMCNSYYDVCCPDMPPTTNCFSFSLGQLCVTYMPGRRIVD